MIKTIIPRYIIYGDLVMPKSLLEMAVEIVSGQSSQRVLSESEIDSLLRTTYHSLERLETSGALPESISTGVQVLEASQPDASETPVTPKIDPADSIREAVIVCLECGREFRQLTHTHLQREHGSTPEQYKRKFGIPLKQPLAAKSVTGRRKAQALERNVGEQLKQARAAKRAGQTGSQAEKDE